MNPLLDISSNSSAADVCNSQLMAASAFSISKLPASGEGLHLGSKCPGNVGLAPRSRRGPKVVCAVGEVSSDSNVFLIAGAIGIAVLGSAFPIFFSRKDLCPECDGAGFVRKSGAKLTANAARKDLDQIVCRRCNGLGKLAQVDK